MLRLWASYRTRRPRRRTRTNITTTSCDASTTSKGFFARLGRKISRAWRAKSRVQLPLLCEFFRSDSRFAGSYTLIWADFDRSVGRFFDVEKWHRVLQYIVWMNNNYCLHYIVQVTVVWEKKSCDVCALKVTCFRVVALFFSKRSLTLSTSVFNSTLSWCLWVCYNTHWMCVVFSFFFFFCAPHNNSSIHIPRFGSLLYSEYLSESSSSGCMSRF